MVQKTVFTNSLIYNIIKDKSLEELNVDGIDITKDDLFNFLEDFSFSRDYEIGLYINGQSFSYSANPTNLYFSRSTKEINSSDLNIEFDSLEDIQEKKFFVSKNGWIDIFFEYKQILFHVLAKPNKE